jgi:hypothetical protein
MTPKAGYVFLAVAVVAIGLGTMRVFAASFEPDPRATLGAFVDSVNRGDWGAACRMYSPRYLKISQAQCRRFWSWGKRIYGPYRYVLVRTDRSGARYHAALRCRGRVDFVDLVLEEDGWKVIAGGW